MELPRAVPLVYRLDANLKPIRLEGAAPYLSGEYAGDPEEVCFFVFYGIVYGESTTVFCFFLPK